MSNFASAIDVLRIERNRLLHQCDHYMIADWPITEEKRNEWKAYRQALRDLPQTSQPELDENFQLINLTWPPRPQE